MVVRAHPSLSNDADVSGRWVMKSSKWVPTCFRKNGFNWSASAVTVSSLLSTVLCQPDHYCRSRNSFVGFPWCFFLQACHWALTAFFLETSLRPPLCYLVAGTSLRREGTAQKLSQWQEGRHPVALQVPKAGNTASPATNKAPDSGALRLQPPSRLCNVTNLDISEEYRPAVLKDISQFGFLWCFLSLYADDRCVFDPTTTKVMRCP